MLFISSKNPGPNVFGNRTMPFFVKIMQSFILMQNT